MNWNEGIRTFHRWMALAFMTVVVGIFITLGLGNQPPYWVYYVPLLPLGLLMLTGVYLFALPYFIGWDGGRRAE